MFRVLRTVSAPKIQTRNITASARRADVAKLTLVGRLGKEPLVKTNVNDKEYVVYTVATTNPPGPQNPDGTRRDTGTSWHTIMSFNQGANKYLKTLLKGSLVFVEANYELREADLTADPESPAAKKQVFLRHESIRVLHRPQNSKEEETSA